MKNSSRCFEDIIQADPTLKFLLRESKFDYDLLEHQANIRGSAILIAISKLLDTYNY